MIIAFDVNETLLDLAPLDPLFEDAFGDASLRRQWFAQMLQFAFVGGLTDRYVDFTTAQHAALVVLAGLKDVDLDPAQRDGIVDAMRSLPAHPDVEDGLARLKDAGFTLATLTNSPRDVARDQIAHAGLGAFFDATLSADQVRVLKPRREAYALVAETFDVALEEVRLVAAHGWDIAGALAAGCAGAFVARPGQALIPIGEQPDIVGDDLRAVAELITARDRP
jgi:2-haloacid dehalogenase